MLDSGKHGVLLATPTGLRYLRGTIGIGKPTATSCRQPVSVVFERLACQSTANSQSYPHGLPADQITLAVGANASTAVTVTLTMPVTVTTTVTVTVTTTVTMTT